MPGITTAHNRASSYRYIPRFSLPPFRAKALQRAKLCNYFTYKKHACPLLRFTHTHSRARAFAHLKRFRGALTFLFRQARHDHSAKRLRVRQLPKNPFQLVRPSRTEGPTRGTHAIPQRAKDSPKCPCIIFTARIALGFKQKTAACMTGGGGGVCVE